MSLTKRRRETAQDHLAHIHAAHSQLVDLLQTVADVRAANTWDDTWEVDLVKAREHLGMVLAHVTMYAVR
jgi:hypothetical protein